MKKFINRPENLVEEMLEGFVKANADKVRRLPTERVLVRKDAPVKGKVGIVTGGGSGHKPAFIGYIG
ncbi:MAG: dihydroxyacetone kinase subunit DhaK, partial [Candidatus Caldatribacteriaceae bacterium]